MSSQHFTSTTDIMNSMKELFSDVLQTVMEAELEDKQFCIFFLLFFPNGCFHSFLIRPAD